MEDIIQKTYKFANDYHSRDNTGHDFNHIKRVYANVLKLLKNEPSANEFIVKMAALLHDVDDHKLNTDGKNALRFLQTLNLDSDKIEEILKTANSISFSKSGANPNFETLEMKILSDADKLDAMGAIGICRTIIYGTAKNRTLFDESVFPHNNNTDDHAINHFFDKLLKLKGAMQTDAGKTQAQSRHEFMLDFLYQFFDEQKQDNWKSYLDDYVKKTG